MKNLICAGNWKLHKDPQETEEFLEALFDQVEPALLPHFLIFPPAVNLMTMAETVGDRGLQWGAQNVYTEDSGAFTGETSAHVVAHIGATHTLIGHSERRSLFGETDAEVAAKVATVLKSGMTPVVCVGETLEQRENGQTMDVVSIQVAAALKNFDSNKDMVFAYEPVWAIGTGKVASPEMAEEVHKAIRTQLEKEWGTDKARETSLLYGGSVKPENAADLASQENIDGFLIGGASLKPESFVEIGKTLLKG